MACQNCGPKAVACCFGIILFSYASYRDIETAAVNLDFLWNLSLSNLLLISSFCLILLHYAQICILM